MTTKPCLNTDDIGQILRDVHFLTASEAGFYLRLVLDNLLFPGMLYLNFSRFARIGGCTDASVKKYLATLEQAGLIEVRNKYVKINFSYAVSERGFE